MIGVCDLRHLFLDWVQTLTAFVNCTFTVCHNNVLKSHRNKKFDNCDSGSSCSGSNDLNVFDFLANNLQRIDHTCKCNNCSTMLVVMENRNITALFQLLLNLKASRCGNILQVYTAEASSQKANGLHNLIYILASNTKRNSIYITKLFEQNAFALHNRHTSLWTDISKSKNSGTVSYYSNRIPTSGQFITFINIFLNLKARLCNTRGVSKA